MTTYEVGQRLVEMIKSGEHRRAIEELYADDAVALEAAAMPGHGREIRGKEALLAHNDRFFQTMEIHDAGIDGPYPCDDAFICMMWMDATPTEGPMAGQMIKMREAAHYTVRDGRIATSTFFYHVPC